MARILIVDDEESIRTLLQEVLNSNGHDCEIVGTAMEALGLIAAKRYDLVIMDQNMPLMTGSEAVVRLRADPKHRDLPILMSTAKPLDQDIGASGYLSKPIDLHKLIETVASLAAPRAGP